MEGVSKAERKGESCLLNVTSLGTAHFGNSGGNGLAKRWFCREIAPCHPDLPPCPVFPGRASGSGTNRRT